MNLIAIPVFIVLQILFIPLAIIGAVLVAYKQLAVSKRLGVSQTGIEVMNGRWTMHIFGMRDDLACSRLANALPNTSTFGLWLALFPLWVKYVLSGTYFGYPRIPEEGAEGIGDLVVARTLYFDRIIERVIGDVEQFVMMGAGYDTRAYGDLKDKEVKFFELDQVETQGLKISNLEKAGINAGHVKFVQVDFSQERAFDKLKEAGYDPTKKTLFLWEGVTLYLNEQDVRKTMQDIHDNAASGSVVIADFYAERFTKGKSVPGGEAALKTLEYTNEGLSFGLPFNTAYEATLRNFIESEQLVSGDTYFMGRTHKDGPYMVVAAFSVCNE